MRTDRLLFSESSGFVVEARPGREARLAEILREHNLEPVEIGKVTQRRRIMMNRGDETIVDLDLDEARKAWMDGLVEAMR
jgi:phosphoribosylformylglycinamidine synthase